MFELPPLLLALAFILVGLAAWFLGRRNGTARTVRLPRDYYVGLDHLINDRFDHAAEIFARMAEADGDAAEIQFALGSLFRRRGEVDRAIAIHSRLREHGGPRAVARRRRLRSPSTTRAPVSWTVPSGCSRSWPPRASTAMPRSIIWCASTRRRATGPRR